jgi:HK97 family phage major capsid protein
MAFNNAEFGCWKVAGYFAVCNSNIEDADIDLEAELLSAIGRAIGLALDKAILYGTGVKMPLGIVARLAQTSQPADYLPTARPWVDLHTTHILTIANSVTGVDLFKTIMLDSAVIKGKYSRGEKVWVMNETTYTFLKAQAMSVNAAGAIVAGVDGTMPVIGGIVEVLDFVPDYVVLGGYFDVYALAERAGTKFMTSEHVRFLQDQTVFKGTARYDGRPLAGEAFVIVNYANTSPETSKDFADDDANSVQEIRLNTHSGAISGTGTLKLKAITAPGKGTVTWATGDSDVATVSTAGVVTGVSAGTTVITATSNGVSDSCTVTVS